MALRPQPVLRSRNRRFSFATLRTAAQAFPCTGAPFRATSAANRATPCGQSLCVVPKRRGALGRSPWQSSSAVTVRAGTPRACHGKIASPPLRMSVTGSPRSAVCATRSRTFWSSGTTIKQIIADHPDLEREDLLAALEFAALAAGGPFYSLLQGSHRGRLDECLSVPTRLASDAITSSLRFPSPLTVHRLPRRGRLYLYFLPSL